MIVNVQLCVRRDVDFKFLMLGNGLRDFFVQRVDALDHDGNVFVHPNRLAHLTLARLEVEAGKRHLFAVDEVKEVLIEQLDVEAVDVLKVELTYRLALNFRNFILLEVIVVHGDRDGIDTARQELDPKSIAECRLAARARTCDRDEPDIFDLALDCVAQLCKLFVVARLAHLHEFENLAPFDLAVDVVDSLHLRLVRPIVRLLQRLTVDRLLLELGNARVEVVTGVLNDDTRAVGRDRVVVDTARRRHHVVVQIVVIFAALIEVHRVLGTVFQNLDLVVEVEFFVDFNRLVDGHRDPLDGQIRLDDALHFLGDRVDRPRHVEVLRECLAGNGARNVVGKPDLHVGIDPVERHRDDIAKTCPVRPARLGIAQAEKLDRHAVVLFGELVIELLDLHAHLTHDEILSVLFVHEVQNPCARRHGQLLTHKVDLYHTFPLFFCFGITLYNKKRRFARGFDKKLLFLLVLIKQKGRETDAIKKRKIKRAQKKQREFPLFFVGMI